MPNCFQLYPMGTSEPAILNEVDARMCAHFGAPVDPRYYFGGWFHVIGFLIAVKGHHLGTPELRADVTAWYDAPTEENLRAQALAILDWLEEHYTSDCWVEIGRR